MVPARVAQASAPWLFGLLLDRWGAGALWFSTALGLAAFLALLLLPRPADERCQWRRRRRPARPRSCLRA